MRLTDLLQMINDLDRQTAFYLSLKKQILPLSKIKISGSECLFYPGKKPMTKEKIIYLTRNLHHRAITILLVYDKQFLPIYGVQIAPNGKWAKLT